ncbi:MAG: arginase family protein [Candidatus Hodarchaeales archaeon]
MSNLDFVSHQPHSFCGLIKTDWKDKTANYNLLGIPLDISSSYRPGSRFGPDSLRRVLRSENFECVSGKGIDLTKYFRLKDWGNIGVVNTDIEKSLKRVSEGIIDLISFQSPFLILGGDHSITIGVGKAFENANIPMHTIYIDAHLDLYDEVNESRLSHACSLRRLSELETFDGATILGYRDFLLTHADYAKQNDMLLFSTSSLQDQRNLYQFGSSLIKKLALKHQYFHISVDLDVLDPSFAPGVGNPVSCGLSSRELVLLLSGIFNALPPERKFSWDIVEYNPLFDNADITAFFVIKLLIESLGEQIKYISR